MSTTRTTEMLDKLALGEKLLKQARKISRARSNDPEVVALWKERTTRVANEALGAIEQAAAIWAELVKGGESVPVSVKMAIDKARADLGRLM